MRHVWHTEMIIYFYKSDLNNSLINWINTPRLFLRHLMCSSSIFIGMNFAIALVPIFLLLRKGIASPCAASYSVQGQVLQNHTIKTETAERIEDCMMQCIEYPGCHSSNFYRIDRRSELNDKTHASHQEHMGYKAYTIYTENTFRPMPCRNKLDCGRQMICSSSLFCEGMPCAQIMEQLKRPI